MRKYYANLLYSRRVFQKIFDDGFFFEDCGASVADAYPEIDHQCVGIKAAFDPWLAVNLANEASFCKCKSQLSLA